MSRKRQQTKKASSLSSPTSAKAVCVTTGGTGNSFLALAWANSRVTLLAVFVLCFLWIAFIRLHTADEPLDRDVSTQILMGRVLAEGGKMYVDTIEFKPPGMFVIWQVIHQLVGTSPEVVVWVNILVTTFTLVGVFLAASAKPWGRISGLWAMVFWALISGEINLQANQPCNEVFINMFMAWGIAMWLRADSSQKSKGYYAAAGLLLGLATLIKPVLLTVLFMALAWILSEGLNPAALKRRAIAIGWVLLPIVALWMLMVLYFVWQGRITEFYNCLVGYGLFYARSGINNSAGNTTSIWMNILDGLGKNLIPLNLVFVVPLIVLMAWGIWGGLRGYQRSQALTLVGCLLGTFLAVSIPGKFFVHYYQLYLPVLVVGAGWGVVATANVLQRWAVAQMAGILILGCLLYHIIPDCRISSEAWSRQSYGGRSFIEFERCGRAVNQMLEPDECFYLWGVDTSVYYYSDRRPASGIFWADRLLSGPSKAQATQKVIADLEKNQPPLILIEDNKDLVPSQDNPVYQWVSTNYIVSPEARFSKYFTVCLRRGSALAARLAGNPQPFILTLTNVDSVFLRYISDVYLQRGRTNEAGAYLQKAVEIDHDNPNVEDCIDLSHQLLEIRQRTAAIHILQTLVRFNPDYCNAHDLLGVALGNNGQTEEAISQFHEAIRLDPGLASAHYNLGSTLYGQGQNDEAIHEFQEAIRLQPDMTPAHLSLGDLLLHAKAQPDEAVIQYQAVVHRYPDSAEFRNKLAMALDKSGQGAKAIRQYQEAIRLKPDAANIHYNLGNAFYEQDRTDEAISEYREALRLNPDNAEFQKKLNQALAAKSQPAGR